MFPLTHDEKIVELKEVKYTEAVTKLDTIHDCEVYADAKGYKKSWLFRHIYIKWGEEGLQQYARKHGINPRWVYIQRARYRAQGINKE